MKKLDINSDIMDIAEAMMGNSYFLDEIVNIKQRCDFSALQYIEELENNIESLKEFQRLATHGFELYFAFRNAVGKTGKATPELVKMLELVDAMGCTVLNFKHE